MRRCPAVQENRLALLDQITAYPADRSLGFDVVDEPGHDISLRRRPSTERSAMGPLQQPLPFQDSKIFPQGGLADGEDRSQLIQMDPPATRDESRDFLLSLCGKKRGCGFVGHKEKRMQRDDI